MAFQLTKTTQKSGKVFISVQPDPSKPNVVRQDSFDAMFDVVDQDTYEEIDAAVSEGNMTPREVVEKYFVGTMTDFLDLDKKPIEFAGAKAYMLTQSNYITAIYNAWSHMQLGVKQKNSKK